MTSYCLGSCGLDLRMAPSPVICVASDSRLKFSPISSISGLQVRSRTRNTRAQAVSLTSTSASSECGRLWSCRSGLGFSISSDGGLRLLCLKMGRLASGSRRRDFAGQVQASLLGVGAPEALVIAVVALVVFGPKGLAEIARTLGKSLKAFQPTIQELTQVSREFRSTLEQEIGLDELRKPLTPPPTYQQPPPQQQPPNGAPEAKAPTPESYMRVTPEQAKALVPEDLRREAEAAAWGNAAPPKAPSNSETKPEVIEQETPREPPRNES